MATNPVTTSGNGFKDAAFDYTFTTANPAPAPGTVVRGGVISINTDADFVWRAVFVTAGNSVFGGGALSVQFRDSHGFPLSDGFISSNQLTPLFNCGPYLIFPEMLFPAGGVIGVDYTSFGAVCTVVLRGVKRFGRC